MGKWQGNFCCITLKLLVWVPSCPHLWPQTNFDPLLSTCCKGPRTEQELDSPKPTATADCLSLLQRGLKPSEPSLEMLLNPFRIGHDQEILLRVLGSKRNQYRGQQLRYKQLSKGGRKSWGEQLKLLSMSLFNQLIFLQACLLNLPHFPPDNRGDNCITVTGLPRSSFKQPMMM